MEKTKTKLETRIEDLQNVYSYVREQEKSILADAMAYAISQGVEEMQFDWDESDAPSCVYSIDDDLMDCYITKIKFDKDFPLTCTKVTLHAYYVGDDYEVSIEDINDYDKLDLAQYIINNL